MREHYHKKVNVLDIDVSVMRPEKAVNISMDFMKRKGLKTIFFLSALSALYCKNNPEAADVVALCDMVLTGDRHTELAAAHRQDAEDTREGIGEFADEYLKRFFSKLARERRSVYAVVEQEQHLDSLKEYIAESYPGISCQGIVYEPESGVDRIVNEINACIPDVVFLCLDVADQISFVKDYEPMMNTRLCICIESVQPMIRKETEEIPGWIKFLHLDQLYVWFKREQKIRNTIAGSIFKKKVLNETADLSEEKSEEDLKKTPSEKSDEK